MASVTNRRREMRAPTTFPGIALLDRHAHCTVEGLSHKGALLLGVQAPLGARIRLHVDLYGQPLLVHARVVRVDADAIAVAFDALHPRAEARLRSAVLQALETQRITPAVLVVDDSPGICKALTRDLRALGYDVLTAITPLEAVWQLEDPSLCVQAAIVDARLDLLAGADLLAFIAEEYPAIRRIMISGLLSGDILAAAANTARCHACIEKPWQRTTLANALLL